MATAFHVYVEGPVDRSPDAIERLASAISSKFGLPAADLVRRMNAGRFRVKANIDRATAETYQVALEEVGARVKIEEAHPTQPNEVVRPASSSVPPPSPPRQNSAVARPAKAERSNRYSVSPPMSSARTLLRDDMRGKPPTAPPPPSTPPTTSAERSGPTTAPPTTARTTSSSALPPPTASRPPASPLPPPTGSRPASSSLPPATAAKPSPAFQSGLSAAYSQEVPVSADLGALGSDAISLAALDGKEDAQRPAASFEPPSPGMPASIGPPPSRPVEAPAAKPVVAPLDLFAPPDADDDEQAVELATDELEHRAKKMSVPPVSAPLTPSQGVPTSQPLAPTRRHVASKAMPMQGGVSAPETPRARILAGVFLSILLGFIPAHLIAASREESAFAAIDAQVVAIQQAADSPEEFEALDAFRDAQIARKKSERKSIALTSMLIWAAVSAGLAYVWFRRVPWDRLGKNA